MKDEIKEINIKFPGQILDYVDTKEHLLELFNYITNLQTIEQQYSAILSENVELENKLTNLQEEKNKQLDKYKNVIDKIKEKINENRYGNGELCLDNQETIKLLELLEEINE